jgi:hypothetical protein
MFEPALAGQSRPTGGSSDDLSDYDLLDEKTRFRGGIDQQTGKLTAAAGSEKVLSKAKQSTRAPTPKANVYRIARLQGRDRQGLLMIAPTVVFDARRPR